MSARADYLKWRRSSAVGCVFARWLSAHPGEAGQKIEEVSQSKNPERVAAAIAARIDQLVSDKSISAATLILPRITTLEGLTKVALALRGYPKWKVSTTKLLPPPTADLVRVHIVRRIPFKKTTRPSEVLVFGKFNVFPPTRRSPVTAFEVFVGEPMRNDPGSGTVTKRANLAHVDLRSTDITPNLYNNMWDGSQKGRLRELGVAEDLRAKAKVSFVISSALALKLGCAPP